MRQQSDWRAHHGNALARRNSGRANVRLILLGSVVGLSLICAWVYVSKFKPSPVIRPDSADVIVDRKMQVTVSAVKDIPIDSKITADAVEERDIPASNAPVGAVDSVSAVVGHIARTKIDAGMIITEHDLRKKGREMLKHFRE